MDEKRQGHLLCWRRSCTWRGRAKNETPTNKNDSW